MLSAHKVTEMPAAICRNKTGWQMVSRLFTRLLTWWMKLADVCRRRSHSGANTTKSVNITFRCIKFYPTKMSDYGNSVFYAWAVLWSI